MGQMIQRQQAQTMSSREIAVLTGKRHHHVVRDIRAMIEQLGDEPDLGHLSEERDERGYTACFHLDRYYSEVLVTGYDVHRRAAVIRRWMELEQQAQQSVDPIQVLSDPAAMHLALLAQAKAARDAGDPSAGLELAWLLETGEQLVAAGGEA